MPDDFNPNIPPPKKVSILEQYIMEKLKRFTLVMLVQGYMQMGKSTLVWYLMNDISEKMGKGEWNYKKFCARNLTEFIDMIDKYENELIVFEEASKDISIDTWYDNINHFFNVVMQTQAYKHNLVCLVFPHSASISNRQKYFIKLGLEVVDRIDTEDCHATVFRPTLYSRNFWRLDENDLHYKWWGSCFIKYTKDDLEKSKEYTKWLEEMKQNTMISIKRRLKRAIDKTNEFDYQDIKLLEVAKKCGIEI